MKKELSPAIVWGIIVVVVVAVVVVGYTMFGPKPVNYDAKGSENLMKKVQDGGKMYEPPGTKTPDGKFIPPGQGGGGPSFGPPRTGGR